VLFVFCNCLFKVFYTLPSLIRVGSVFRTSASFHKNLTGSDWHSYKNKQVKVKKSIKDKIIIVNMYLSDDLQGEFC
jgi:hypothetical protein